MSGVGPPGYLTPAKVRAAYQLYRAGMSTAEIARHIYRRYGYANADVCEHTLRRRFHRYGWGVRNVSAARRLMFADQPCAGCGCAAQERSPRCATCTNRHSAWRKAGRPFKPAVCQGCGCTYDQHTEGCAACRCRKYLRSKRSGRTPSNGRPNTAGAPTPSLRKAA